MSFVLLSILKIWIFHTRQVSCWFESCLGLVIIFPLLLLLKCEIHVQYRPSSKDNCARKSFKKATRVRDIITDEVYSHTWRDFVNLYNTLSVAIFSQNSTIHVFYRISSLHCLLIQTFSKQYSWWLTNTFNMSLWQIKRLWEWFSLWMMFGVVVERGARGGAQALVRCKGEWGWEAKLCRVWVLSK